VYYAYFIDHSGGSQNDVGLATSTDGINFSYQGKVLKKGESYDQLQASFPDVQYDQGSKTWYMLYEAKSAQGDVNSVCLATSSDGRHWDKRGPVISPGQAGEMSEVDVGTPTFSKDGDQWNVYFHGLAKDGRVRIGHASGTDLANLTVDQGAALDVDASGPQSGTVGARSNVVKQGGWYYMAYECSTAAKDFGQAQWGTALARSRTPSGGWEKLDTGPIIANPKTGYGFDGPELSQQDGRLYLYYRMGGNGTSRQEITGLG
jgi:beta-xylosidase